MFERAYWARSRGWTEGGLLRSGADFEVSTVGNGWKGLTQEENGASERTDGH